MYGLPVGFDNVFANREAQAAAANFPGPCQVGPVKPFKYPEDVFFRYAVAVVTDFH